MAVNVLSTEATANPALVAAAADTEAAFSIVCRSPQAWDTALPTNRQQIMKRFARRKLYEYLAAGKPVVVSGNPDLIGMEPDVLVARGAEAFAAAIETALTTRSDADRERRTRIASRNTWETRTQQLHDLVAAAIG